jgi:hypothetical protein
VAAPEDDTGAMPQNAIANPPQRSRCLHCGAHTFSAECGNCASVDLQAVTETRGDARTARPSLTAAAHEWRQQTLEARSSASKLHFPSA